MQRAADAITVFAAGSLRAPFTQAARAFEAEAPGLRIDFVFGASGLLRERIAGGEPADLFASANLAHPQALREAHGYGPIRVFARNALCALVRPGLAVTPETLVQAMLDPALRLGTSTPGSDPSGDYAVECFQRFEQCGAAPAGALAAKALRLTGAPGVPKPAGEGNVYGRLVASGAADIFITYRTNAVIAVAERSGLRQVEIDPKCNVGAAYGLTVYDDAPPAAQRFADALCDGAGQAALRHAGFLPP
jgi:ABC-type molybdate transport system substrate-binding protein